MPAITVEHLKNRWQQLHRGRLHDIASWNIDAKPQLEDQEFPAISLTYAGSGAAASGPAQLQRLFALCPADSHLFSPERGAQLNSKVEVLSCSIDASRRTVTEEFLLSAPHYDQMDWLLPGVSGTHRSFTLAFVLA